MYPSKAWLVILYLHGQARQYSALTKMGFGVLACNSALAIYRSWGDTASFAFILTVDAVLVLLFFCLREFKRDAGRARHSNMKVAVLVLTTLLTTMFASKVAPLMPPVVAMTVWLMSAATGHSFFNGDSLTGHPMCIDLPCGKQRSDGFGSLFICNSQSARFISDLHHISVQLFFSEKEWSWWLSMSICCTQY